MRASTLVAAAAVLLPLPFAPLTAQTGSGFAAGDTQSIAESVIRIRTIADLEYRRTDHRTGEVRQATRPYSIDGTGVVVGEMEVEGRTEYLILTNHHVADASNYVLEVGGYMRMNPTNTRAVPSVHEESYLMRSASDEISGEDIRLIELVRLVRGDMTLMRTVGANRELAVFQGEIGFRPGEVRNGDAILTSGYPWGGERVVATGRIIEIDHPHDLGIPHEDLIVDIGVEPGQSGGPVFLASGGDDGTVVYRLIGLIHAKDPVRSYAVPYTLWNGVLDEFPEELQGRLVR